MLHFISYHAPGVLGADRPDERSVEAPLERISWAIKTIDQKSHILGRTPDGKYTSYLNEGTVFVLREQMQALRLISDSSERLQKVLHNLNLPYSAENVFPYVAD